MLVSLMMGDQIVLPYSIMGLVMAVYVCVSVSLVFPQFVPDIALYMFVVFSALVLVCLTCSAYVSFGSNVRPSILGCLFVSSVMLFICSCKLVEYSAGSDVKSVVCVLFALSISLFCSVQCTISFRYVCSCCWAI